jgi:hypothetical protein
MSRSWCEIALGVIYPIGNVKMVGKAGFELVHHVDESITLITRNLLILRPASPYSMSCDPLPGLRRRRDPDRDHARGNLRLPERSPKLRQWRRPILCVSRLRERSCRFRGREFSSNDWRFIDSTLADPRGQEHGTQKMDEQQRDQIG